VDENMLTVVVLKGRNVPSAVAPAQLAETVMLSIVPPPPGSSQLSEVAHPHGDMAVLQTPMPTSGYGYYEAPQDVVALALPPYEQRIMSPSQMGREMDNPLARVNVSESVYVGSSDRRELVKLSPNVRQWSVEDVVTWLCQFEPLRSKAYVQEIRRMKVIFISSSRVLPNPAIHA
jgi:hypothetical protein